MRNTIRSVAAVAVIATATAGASAQQGQAIQWRVEDGGNGHWYQLIRESRQWIDARTRAIAMGGDLCSIESSAEWSSLLDLFCGDAQVPCGATHIGGRQMVTATSPSQGWRWLTAPTVALSLPLSMNDSPCSEGQPGENGEEDFLYLSTGWTMLSDINSGEYSATCGTGISAHWYLVEWSADCNGDGVVDFGQILSGQFPDTNQNGVPDACDSGTIPAVQWRLEDGGNGHWYQVRRTSGPTDYDHKAQLARLVGGHLASIADQAENDFVFGAVVASGLAQGRVCTGARRICSSCPWQWEDGTPWGYLNWGPGEPGNPGAVHVEMFLTHTAPSRWADIWNWDTSEGSYIIEWSADCDGDATVDYGQILSGQRVDVNRNGVPDICELGPCPGDVTGNKSIDGIDLAAVLGAWGTSGQGEFLTDVDRDGTVSGNDLAYILSGWGPCPE